MKSKEEILKKHPYELRGSNYLAEKDIYAAMDEYAKQECIAFENWRIKRAYQKTIEQITTGRNQLPESTGELYTEFIKTKL